MNGTLKIALCLVAAGAGLWVYHAYFAPRAREPRLAPDGTFYLRQYVSVRTAHGITGLAAGEMVHRLNAPAHEGLIKVSNGDCTFDVYSDALTNDLDVAESLSASDADAQRALRDSAALARIQAQQADGVVNAAHASDVANFDAGVRNGSRVGTLASPLTSRPSDQIVGGAFAPASGYIVVPASASKPYTIPPHWSPPKGN